MHPIYTPQDHDRLSKISERIVRDNEILPDEEFGIVATNLMLNVIMRIQKEKRNLALVQIMSCIKKAIKDPEIR